MDEPAYEFDELTIDERRWLEAQRAAAVSFVARYGGAGDASELGPSELERAYEAWLKKSGSRFRLSKQTDINDMVNAVGVALGDWIIARTGMRWRIITDGFGTDLGLHMTGNGEYSDIVTHPTNFVAKRAAERVSGWLTVSAEMLVVDLIRMRDDAGPADGGA